jgi:PAS domain S-box-containing protein
MLDTLQSEFEQLIQHPAHAIRIINNDFTIRFINKAFANMSGITPEEAIGRKCREIFSGPFCNTCECSLIRILNGETFIQRESEHTKYDGTNIPCIINVIPLYSNNGEITGIIETFTDITEKKQLQDTFQELETCHQSLIELESEAGEAVVVLQDINGREGMQVYAGDAWSEITGYSRDELLAMSFFDIVSPREKRFALSAYRLKMTGQPVRKLPEISIQRKDGSEAIIEFHSMLTHYKKMPALTLLIRDITQYKELQSRLGKTERLYHTIFNTSVTAMHILDDSGTIILVNDQWEKLFGYSKQQAEGKMKCKQLIPKTQLRPIEAYTEKRVHLPVTAPKIYEGQIKDGAGKHKDVLITLNTISGTSMYVVSYIDITSLKQVERRLRNSEARLRMLSRRMICATETERDKIARELHDELSQGLVAARLEAISLAEKLHEPVQISRINSLIENLGNLLDTVRNISADIRPKMLDELGLVGAIQWYIERFEQRTSIPCLINIDKNISTIELEKEVISEIYRILQEALLNVFRHSKANYIITSMYLRNNKLIVSISDNGIGFDIKKLGASQSLGLLGMHERAALAGGKLKIQTHPGKGTRITASFPLRTSEPVDKAKVKA